MDVSALLPGLNPGVLSDRRPGKEKQLLESARMHSISSYPRHKLRQAMMIGQRSFPRIL